MQMRVYKPFYMIFVLIRACLWNVNASFAGYGDSDASSDKVNRSEAVNGNLAWAAEQGVKFMAENNATDDDDFLRTQVSHVNALPVFHRDKNYNARDIHGERARFLKQLLFPNHSFG